MIKVAKLSHFVFLGSLLIKWFLPPVFVICRFLLFNTSPVIKISLEWCRELMALLIKDQIRARAQFRLSMRNTNKFQSQSLSDLSKKYQTHPCWKIFSSPTGDNAEPLMPFNKVFSLCAQSQCTEITLVFEKRTIFTC